MRARTRATGMRSLHRSNPRRQTTPTDPWRLLPRWNSVACVLSAWPLAALLSWASVAPFWALTRFQICAQNFRQTGA
jgi:hypothetical protein